MSTFGLSVLFAVLSGSMIATLRSLRFSEEAGLARLAEKFPKAEKRIRRWTSARRFPRILATTSFMAGVFQVLAVWLAAESMRQIPDGAHVRAVSWIIGFTVGFILLTRFLPAVLASHYADRISLMLLSPMGWLANLSYPLSWTLATFENRLDQQLASKTDEGHRPTAGDEILTLVDQSEEHELEAEEKEIIRSVFEFGDTIIREIMTPRVNMTGLEDNLTVGEAVNEIKDTPFSRFPVFHEDFDEIRGMIHVKNLIRAMSANSDDQPIVDFMISLMFVPESMPINDLLQLMKANKVQTAIAVDEYGGTAGVVTIEDILEELVGEIEDEHDPVQERFKRLAYGAYLVEASVPVDEINEELGFSIPEAEEYDSVGGYLLFAMGRIPRKGEHVDLDSMRIHVHAATPRKVGQLVLKPVNEVARAGTADG